MSGTSPPQPLVWDGHNDLAWRLRAEAGHIDLQRSAPSRHNDLPRLRAGGVGTQFWSVYVPSALAEPEAVVATLEQVDIVHRMVRLHQRDLALAGTADEVTHVMDEGRIASLLGAEGRWSRADLSKLANGNMLRVLRSVEHVAAE